MLAKTEAVMGPICRLAGPPPVFSKGLPDGITVDDTLTYEPVLFIYVGARLCFCFRGASF